MGTELAINGLERILVNGDLSKLTADQRVEYYVRICEHVGVDPLLRPFDYLNLSGRIVLYAKKECTEQLRVLRGISITSCSHDLTGDVYVVTANGKDKTGRTDVATGAVYIANLKGDALANAYMKCETKAKRRLTLSLSGLGMLDETEIETIPGASIEPVLYTPEPGVEKDRRDQAEVAAKYGIEPPSNPTEAREAQKKVAEAKLAQLRQKVKPAVAAGPPAPVNPDPVGKYLMAGALEAQEKQPDIAPLLRLSLIMSKLKKFDPSVDQDEILGGFLKDDKGKPVRMKDLRFWVTPARKAKVEWVCDRIEDVLKDMLEPKQVEAAVPF